MKQIQITMSEDELLGIWTMCQMALDEFPDQIADEDKTIVKQLSEMLDALVDHECGKKEILC